MEQKNVTDTVATPGRDLEKLKPKGADSDVIKAAVDELLRQKKKLEQSNDISTAVPSSHTFTLQDTEALNFDDLPCFDPEPVRNELTKAIRYGGYEPRELPLTVHCTFDPANEEYIVTYFPYHGNTQTKYIATIDWNGQPQIVNDNGFRKVKFQQKNSNGVTLVKVVTAKYKERYILALKYGEVLVQRIHKN